MADLVVEIIGDTGHLRWHALDSRAFSLVEFLVGSFRPSPDERRVVTTAFNFRLPTSTGDANINLHLRLEFTDPLLATIDTIGRPVYLTAEDRIVPYREAKGKSPVQHQENL